MKRFLILLLLVAFWSGCGREQTAPDAPVDSTAPATEVIRTDVDLAAPLRISDAPGDLVRAQKLDELISQSEFRDARWGYFVVSLADGRVVAARDARKLFTPASVHKLLPAVVALDRLGADFRWKTQVFTSGTVDSGTLNGDLVLYGGGAPDLDEEALRNLATKLKSAGIKRVTGDLIGDESYFFGDKLGDGWAWNELQWYYGAEASALSVDLNLTKLQLENGRPRIAGDGGDFEVSGAVATLAANAPESVGVKRDLGANKFHVWGASNSLEVRVAVENPALWSARRFRKLLEKDGISFGGQTRTRDWRSDVKFDPETSVALASVESAPLAEIVRRMNKDSVNLYAELILRTLGRKFRDEIPVEDPRTRLTRGDDAVGAAVIRQWLAAKRVSERSDESIRDGSGLSRLNLLSPETIGRVLLAAAKIESAKDFESSLAVAGRDGTLRNRMNSANGKIIGKSGSVTFVSSLAGYARRADETLAFVFFCNDQTRKAEVSPLIDALALELLR